MRRSSVMLLALAFSALCIGGAGAQTRVMDPHLLAAKEYRDQAARAYANGEYDRASELVAKARIELGLIEKPRPLPATYIVRMIPDARDCLSKIAGYPFVYNDPEKWPILFQANREKLVDPENEDLIFPGMVITIPSISCEKREGGWNPDVAYIAFPEGPNK